MKTVMDMALEAGFTERELIRTVDRLVAFAALVRADERDRVKEALAQPEQEPDDLTIAYMSGLHDGKKQERALWTLSELGQEIEAQPEERNFCPRCGKRTADLTLVHTCTPPIAADPKAFHGFPSGSVSTPNAGGKCVTAGETAPIAELWAALTAYQPHADTCGHGKSWRKMCEAQTKDAAGVAASHAVVYASSMNVAADAAHIVWAGGDLGVAIAKIKSITR